MYMSMQVSFKEDQKGLLRLYHWLLEVPYHYN